MIPTERIAASHYPYTYCAGQVRAYYYRRARAIAEGHGAYHYATATERQAMIATLHRRELIESGARPAEVI
jgi:hypothetical protein